MLRQTIQAQQAQQTAGPPVSACCSVSCSARHLFSQLLADITSGVTGVTVVCTVKIIFYFLFDKQIASRHSCWAAQTNENNVERKNLEKKTF
eukprot:12710_4